LVLALAAVAVVAKVADSDAAQVLEDEDLGSDEVVA
jgi:hypothetical protein